MESIRIKRAVVSFLLLVAAAFSFTTPVPAHEDEPINAPFLSEKEAQWLQKNHDRIRLFYNTEYPPIEFAAPDGSFIGVGADVIRAVEKKLGFSFKQEAQPDWNKHLAALKSGECAIAPTIVRSSERESYISFTSPYMNVPLVIISTPSLGYNLDLKSLQGRRVAVVSGFVTETYVRKHSDGRFEVVTVKNVVEGLRRVAFGQADALVENLAVAAYYIEKEGIPNLVVSGTTDYYFAWSIGISRKYPLLYSSMQKALNALTEDELTKIRKKWIALEVQKGLSPEDRRMLKLGTFFTLLLLLSLIIITWLLKRRLNEKVESLKAAQAENLEQAERLHLATEATGAIVWDYFPHSDEFRFSNVSFHLEEGRTGNSEWARAVYPPDRETLIAALKDFIKKGGEGEFEVEFRMHQKDDSWRWVTGKGRTIARDDAGNPLRIIGLNLDIHNIKEVQEKLELSQSRFESLFMHAPLPLAEILVDETIVMLNHRFTQVLGYTIEDIPTVGEWFPLAYPDPVYRDEVITTWSADVEEALATGGEVVSKEYRVTAKNGTVHTMLIGASIIAENILVSLFDITEREQAEMEREKLQVQLLHSQKMEAIGILAGGVAHDFNNMLGGIMGYTQLTMKKLGTENPLYGNLEKIMKASERSSDMVRQLLAFARKQTAEPMIVNINKSVEGILKILERIIGENIDLAWHPGRDEGMIKIDPSQFDQILTNLCVNARDAIDDVGRIIIETGTVFFDEEFCQTHKGFLPGEHVVLSVADNGKGMDEETREHVFEPFYTTKRVGEGTGLGLATVYGIVKQNEGFIDLYSEPGTGTTFKIYFPSHSGEKETLRAENLDAVPTGAGETVLVVEDDPMILETSTLMLEELGYIPLSASSPAAALELAREYQEEAVLLITDVVMPEMNGKELAEKIRAIIPAIRIIYMSGYAADIIRNRGFFDSAGRYLQKPFTSRDLGVTVYETLYLTEE